MAGTMRAEMRAYWIGSGRKNTRQTQRFRCFGDALAMANEPCPKHECGFWGIPLEKLCDLRSLSDEQYECCLWRESREKCRRNPRFQNAPDAEDCFDPVTPEDFEDLE